jgi:hypothetical protein
MLLMNEYFIAWWNVENLFDVENSTIKSLRIETYTFRINKLKIMIENELRIMIIPFNFNNSNFLNKKIEVKLL